LLNRKNQSFSNFRKIKKDRIRKNSLEELRRLAETADIKVVQETNINVQSYTAATLIGSGKIDELKKLAKTCHAEMVIFDDDISPTQERNLEKQLDLRIIDRTYLILEIFSARAQTYEGKLQVELARLSYKITRLSGKGRQLEQQRGLIGARGPGERKLEFEKRIIRKKTTQLKKETCRHKERPRRAPGKQKRPAYAADFNSRLYKCRKINFIKRAYSLNFPYTRTTNSLRHWTL